MAGVTARVRAELDGGPARTARELAQLAGAAKSEVNAALYGTPSIFRCLGGQPPRWHLATAEPASLTPPRLYPWQQEAVRAWTAHDHRGVIQAVTGSGKTHTALEAIRLGLAEDRRILILVPTTVLLQQWRNKIYETFHVHAGQMGGGSREDLSTHDVLVSTVQSAYRVPQLLPPGERGLLICDEVHRYGAKAFAKALQPSFDWRLGLTATFERNDDGLEEYLYPYFGSVVFELGYRRALDEGVIAPFRVALVRVNLTPSEQAEYDEHHERAWKARKRLIEWYSVTAEPFGEFIAEVSDLAEHGAPRDPAAQAARTYLNSFATCRRVLGETRVKLDALAALAPTVSDSNGALVFTSTMRGARGAEGVLRGQGVSAATVDSSMPMSDRQRVLRRFGDREVAAVTAPLVLDEGVDVPEADFAIILAASKTRRQMIQRLGRVVRCKEDGGSARLALLVAAETSEDPASGAHMGFIREMLDVADDLRVFSMDEVPAVNAFLAGAAVGRRPTLPPTSYAQVAAPSHRRPRPSHSRRAVPSPPDPLKDPATPLSSRVQLALLDGPMTAFKLSRKLGVTRTEVVDVLEASGQYTRVEGRWYPASQAPEVTVASPAPTPPPSGTQVLRDAWERLVGPLDDRQALSFEQTLRFAANGLSSPAEAERFVRLNRGYIERQLSGRC